MIEALAKLASEITSGPWEWSKGGSLRSEEELAYIAAASPDVVAALCRVALAAKWFLAMLDSGGPDSSDQDEAVAQDFRAALADLDR